MLIFFYKKYAVICRNFPHTTTYIIEPDVSDKSTDTKPKTEEKKQQVNIVNGRPSPAVIKVK